MTHYPRDHVSHQPKGRSPATSSKLRSIYGRRVDINSAEIQRQIRRKEITNRRRSRTTSKALSSPSGSAESSRSSSRSRSDTRYSRKAEDDRGESLDSSDADSDSDYSPSAVPSEIVGVDNPNRVIQECIQVLQAATALSYNYSTFKCNISPHMNSHY